MLCTLCTDKCETVNIQNQPKPTFTLATPRLLFQAAKNVCVASLFLHPKKWSDRKEVWEGKVVGRTRFELVTFCTPSKRRIAKKPNKNGIFFLTPLLFAPLFAPLCACL